MYAQSRFAPFFSVQTRQLKALVGPMDATMDERFQTERFSGTFTRDRRFKKRFDRLLCEPVSPCLCEPLIK